MGTDEQELYHKCRQDSWSFVGHAEDLPRKTSNLCSWICSVSTLPVKEMCAWEGKYERLWMQRTIPIRWGTTIFKFIRGLLIWFKKKVKSRSRLLGGSFWVVLWGPGSCLSTPLWRQLHHMSPPKHHHPQSPLFLLTLCDTQPPTSHPQQRCRLNLNLPHAW